MMFLSRGNGRLPKTLSLTLTMLALTWLQFEAIPASCSAVDNTAVATTELMTALTPAEMGVLQAGQQVDIDSLPGEERDQILNAFALICAGRLPPSIAKPAAGAKRLLQIEPRYMLIIESESLGGSNKVSIDLLRLADKLRIIPDPSTKQSEDKPGVADAPKFETLKAMAPADAASSTTYWGHKAFELLSPIGGALLSNAKPCVPFTLSDFTKAGKSSLSSLDKDKQAFIAHSYDQYCLRAAQLAETQGSTGHNKEAIINGVSAQWLSQKLPVWSALQNVNVQLALEYGIRINVTRNGNSMGSGWAIESEFYYR